MASKNPKISAQLVIPTEVDRTVKPFLDLTNPSDAALAGNAAELSESGFVLDTTQTSSLLAPLATLQNLAAGTTTDPNLIKIYNQAQLANAVTLGDTTNTDGTSKIKKKK